MSMLTGLADYRRSWSIARWFRERRAEHFRSLVRRLPRPLRILDVGGTESFWRMAGLAGEPGVEITTVNVDPEKGAGLVRALEGDARDLSRFESRSFDVAFSNSVIEHVGGADDQRRMAEEIRRVGKAYFVQTPNRWFPIEPHFFFPFFQFLPIAAKVYLLTHLDLGWCGKLRDPEAARRAAESVMLLDLATVRRLFPDAKLRKERVLGLVKSFVAYGGFPEA